MELAEKIELLPPHHLDTMPEPTPPLPLHYKLIQFGFQTLGTAFPDTAAQVAYRLFSTPIGRAKHTRSDEVLESARVFEFLYGEHLLKGYEWGRGAKTVLLVHGWQSRGTALRTFVPPLVESGFRVVAFDGPAHGDSEGKQTNLIHFGGAVRAIIQQLGAVQSIITHSFGGASTVYALASSATAIPVEKLVLIAAPSSMERVWSDAVRLFRLPKPAAKRFKNILERILNRSLQEVDVAKIKHRLHVGETLLVHDRTDQVVPLAESEAIVANWDNASLLISEGHGHYRLMKSPEIIHRVVRFINS